jgi:hypothetical protein
MAEHLLTADFEGTTRSLAAPILGVEADGVVPWRFIPDFPELT